MERTKKQKEEGSVTEELLQDIQDAKDALRSDPVFGKVEGTKSHDGEYKVGEAFLRNMGEVLEPDQEEGGGVVDPVIVEAVKQYVEEVDPDDGKVKWRKTGGGSFRMVNGRIIKQNQVFLARPEDIPMGFRDIVIPVDALTPEEPLKAVFQSYEVRVDETAGWYNVFDGQGKKLNERRMRQAAAEELVGSLQK